MAVVVCARLFYYNDNGELNQHEGGILRIEVTKELGAILFVLKSGTQSVLDFRLKEDVETANMGQNSVLFTLGKKSVVLKFEDVNAYTQVTKMIKEYKQLAKGSIFEQRTDEASAVQYFQFYGYLSQQQNMMQDYIRTSTYQRAMLSNLQDFRDKVVLDVGAGSGILSFFAVQAGARKVYAVEASSIAQFCQSLVGSNHQQKVINVIPGKIEEIVLPEKVDIIISEPMGYMLFNERMLETYLHAKKFMKPGGRMFPTCGDLHIAPFTDEQLYMEQFQKANFWYQQSFHGVNLTCLRDAAVTEYFKQPIVDTFDPRICLSESQKYVTDFLTAKEEDLHTIDIPLHFNIATTGQVHGLAFWFDVAFKGSKETVWLSTSPSEPLTHWYQVRCLLPQPVFVQAGSPLTGRLVLTSNTRQSYDVDIRLTNPVTNATSSNTLDLKNPFFRYTGAAPQPPPGTNTGSSSPTDNYWNGTANGYGSDTHMQVVGQQDSNFFGKSAALEYLPVSEGSGQAASVHPGSIPAVGTLPPSSEASAQTLSSQFLIGDYVTPGNLQQLNTELSYPGLKP